MKKTWYQFLPGVPSSTGVRNLSQAGRERAADGAVCQIQLFPIPSSSKILLELPSNIQECLTQAVLKKIAPQLKRIQQQYKNDPQRIWEETAKLHRKHGVKAWDGSGIPSLLIQAPLFIGLFSAVRRGLTKASRFLWINDLSKPDGILAFFCAALIGLSTAITPTATDQHKTAVAVVPTILTLVFLWRVAAGVGIYTFTSSLVGVAQAFIVRRRPIVVER
jgi:YidC/Oxa1 family membrane protein insertase